MQKAKENIKKLKQQEKIGEEKIKKKDEPQRGLISQILNLIWGIIFGFDSPADLGKEEVDAAPPSPLQNSSQD